MQIPVKLKMVARIFILKALGKTKKMQEFEKINVARRTRNSKTGLEEIAVGSYELAALCYFQRMNQEFEKAIKKTFNTFGLEITRKWNFPTRNMPSFLSDLKKRGFKCNAALDVASIRFELKQNALVSLKLYEMQGREMKNLMNSNKTPGIYDMSFNTWGLAGGVYFYRLQIADYAETGKVVVGK